MGGDGGGDGGGGEGGGAGAMQKTVLSVDAGSVEDDWVLNFPQ